MLPLDSNLLIVDVETTGPNPLLHELLSVALVPVDLQLAPLLVHVREKRLRWTSFGLKNFETFRDEWSNSAVDCFSAAQLIDQYLMAFGRGEPFTLVGHNVGFDRAFLRRLAARSGRTDFDQISHRTIDTHSLLYALVLQGRLPTAALSSDGAFSYFGISVSASERHTALGDAVATRALFLRLVNILAEPTTIARRA